MTTTKSAPNLKATFSHDGLLAQRIEHFHERQEQIAMVQAVQSALDSEQTLICEAGTGTGKTYAYLVPVMLADPKVVISTGTKNLQDQLFERDLAKLSPILGTGKKVVLLKGRANYLCLAKLHQDYSTQELSAKQWRHLNTVGLWAQHTKSGDLATCAKLPENHQINPFITSTQDSCTGQHCQYYQDCFFFKARRRAFKADIIVVNHHLFFAELVNGGGQSSLAQEGATLIFDEAHQLEEIATQYLGEVFSVGQLNSMLRELELVHEKLAQDDLLLLENLEDAQASIVAAVAAMVKLAPRGEWFAVRDSGLLSVLKDLHAALFTLLGHLQSVAERAHELQLIALSLEQQAYNLKQVLSEKLPQNTVVWYEVFSKSFNIHLSPIRVAEQFAKLISFAGSKIFTSATLATGEDFSHFADLLGLKDYQSLLLASPFNYQEQALMYHPRYLPDVRDETFCAKLCASIIPLIHELKGRTLCLFTSFSKMHQSYDILSQDLNMTVLMQGQASKQALIQEFAHKSQAVLLGTSSFWEGVDISSEHLACVVVDKLPFASPGDPLVQAKIKSIKNQGGDPFAAYQLPKAIMWLKQGAGRLIRSKNSLGILVLADSRICLQAYGPRFIKSLPPFRRTRCYNTVLNFCQDL